MGPHALAVTVIGGYLGAGKTTLVNHLLKEADERVAVLVNDFGEINIDAALIESTDGDTITLSNGCICCSLVDGLAGALVTIAALEPPPDRLVIEASGVADPVTVSAHAHAPGLRLDAVLVVVDAASVRTQATDRYVGDTVRRQLAAADLLIINKTDLVSVDDLESLRLWLAAHAPGAGLVETTQAAVPIEILSQPEPTRTIQTTEPPPRGKRAEDQFETWSWESTTPISRAAIETLMDELPKAVIRLKGTLALEDDVECGWVLQRVGQRWTLDPLDDRPTTSQFVAIAPTGTIDGDVFADGLAP